RRIHRPYTLGGLTPTMSLRFISVHREYLTRACWAGIADGVEDDRRFRADEGRHIMYRVRLVNLQMQQFACEVIGDVSNSAQPRGEAGRQRGRHKTDHTPRSAAGLSTSRRTGVTP